VGPSLLFLALIHYPSGGMDRISGQPDNLAFLDIRYPAGIDFLISGRIENVDNAGFPAH
jgi:hypothetical protein